MTHHNIRPPSTPEFDARVRLSVDESLHPKNREFAAPESLSLMRDGVLARQRGTRTVGAARVYEGASLEELRAICLAAGTGDFPTLLGDVVQSRVLDFYSLATQELAFRVLSRRVDLADFRAAKTVRLDLPEMPQIGEGGEVHERLLGAEGEELRLLKFRMIVPLTREAVTNDDVRLLDSLPELIAFAAAGAENRVFMEEVLANRTSSDGNAFWSSAHSNVASAGAFDATRLSESISLLRAQTSPSGVPLNTSPYALLVGPTLERTARELIRDNTIPGTPALRLVIDSRITDGSYYLFSDPVTRPAFYRGRLFGEPDGPTIVTNREPFESDGWKFKGMTNFCVGLGDWRGAVFGPGA